MKIDAGFYSQVHALMPIACVDIAITDLCGHILLVKRAIEPAKGKWWFPGGRVRKGERLAEAARRIVFEEVGLTLAVLSQLDTRETIFKEDPFNHGLGTHTINVIYMAIPSSFEVSIDANHSEFKWLGDVSNEPDVPDEIKDIWSRLGLTE